MGRNTRKGKSKPAPKQLNIWLVLLRIIDGIFDLINNNKIFPALAMMFLLLVALIIWKIPDNEITGVLKYSIDQVVVSKYGYIIALIGSNLLWIYVYKRMVNIKNAEINRLSEIRKQLLHHPDRTLIEHHRSSDGETNEAYILPADATDD